ncbi:MAG TPA: FTR1 family protein [Ktedonobacteraceae bacterium]
MFGKTLAKPVRIGLRSLLALAALCVVSILVWQGITASGNPDPAVSHLDRNAAILDTGILVFREGLECILVLAAITASMMGSNSSYRRPIAAGVGMGLLAVVATWFVAIAVLSQINAPALAIQAATGLLAIVVLLIIMNWFFHKIYWTGWISLHNRRKKSLMKSAAAGERSRTMWGLVVLGLTAVYREGFEIVLFLQSIRLQVGSTTVLEGAAIGVALTAIVGALTFFAHHRLPYKKMLILTGVMLGVVLVVMVGEEVQEMQLAGWLTTTNLALPLPDWMGLWFAVFANMEGLVAQVLAAVFVIGSYYMAEYLKVKRPVKRGEAPAIRPESAPVEVLPGLEAPELLSAGKKGS